MASTSTLWHDMTLVALRSIRSQTLRTSLTIGIIGIGIMALIAMVTATESLKANVRQEFSSLGTQSFSIGQVRSGGIFKGRRTTPSSPIDYREAMRFKRESLGDFSVTASVFGTGMATVSKGNLRSDPNVTVQGVDELFLPVSGLDLALGRNFTPTEINNGSAVVLLGKSLVNRVFQSWEEPVGQYVLVGSQRYIVAGVLESRGTSFGRSQDNQILIPLLCVRRQYSDEGRSYNLTCRVNQAESIQDAVESATGFMRMIRGDAPGEPNTFRIRQSNQIVETLLKATDGIALAAVFIGLVTLLGAGIGLMNIMLVAVSERTREIGTRKSLGASSRAIQTQFLVEVIFIGQMGGVIGIAAGLAAGNIIASYFETPLVVPWAWMTLGVILCFVTSLASGYYPARLASKLDPIVALGRE